MKRIIYSIVALCMVSTMAVSFTSCVGGKTDKPSTEQSSTQQDVSKDEKKDSKSSSKKFATIDEFVKSDVMKKQLETIRSQFKSLGISVDILAEDKSKIVFQYKYEKQVPVTEETKKTMDSSLQSQESVFKGVVTSVESAVNVKNPICVVRYLNADGSEILSKEFTK